MVALCFLSYQGMFFCLRPAPNQLYRGTELVPRHLESISDHSHHFAKHKRKCLPEKKQYTHNTRWQKHLSSLKTILILIMMILKVMLDPKISKTNDR